MTSPVADVERWSAFKVFWFGLFHRTPKSNAVAVAELSLQPGDRFVDLGCGLGAALEQAVTTGCEVAGIDPSPTMVERASRRVPAADVRLGSAESIPFEDDRFTAALSVSTFHHWADPEAGLVEIWRVLAPGGRLLIFERKLKDGLRHGLDPDGATRLVETLVSLGYSSPRVSTARIGRAEYLAVTAVSQPTE
ncbi:MAG: class I SAM-dependent methyltransferase [Acidimicrobiia bacterium]